MIYTITPNPSLDYYVEVDDFNSTKINNGKKEFFTYGGKGINVSKMLSIMETENTAIALVGGFTGERLEKLLDEEKIKKDLIRISGNTRTNIKITSKEECAINMDGPALSNMEKIVFFDKIRSFKKNDIVVLAGATPSNVDHNFYKEICEILKSKGIEFIVDARAKDLFPVLSLNPLLIKPNKEELEEIFNVQILTNQDVLFYAKELVKKGAQNVIVSLGDKGAVFTNYRESYLMNAQECEVLSTVGAGDAMVAGFLYGYTNKMPLRACFKMGIACATSRVEKMNNCKMEDVIHHFESM